MDTILFKKKSGARCPVCGEHMVVVVKCQGNGSKVEMDSKMSSHRECSKCLYSTNMS